MRFIASLLFLSSCLFGQCQPHYNRAYTVLYRYDPVIHRMVPVYVPVHMRCEPSPCVPSRVLPVIVIPLRTVPVRVVRTRCV
jgi:hypothetical protein